MIGYTAGLGECSKVLYHACMFVVPGSSTTCWEIPS